MPQPVDLNRLVREAMGVAYDDWQTRRPGLDVAVEEDLDPEAGVVAAQRADLCRVVANLLENAFDAVEVRARAGRRGSKPAVAVQTRRSGDRVLVRVKDSGVGMDEATRARVFEPFFTTKPPGEGTGLGLSLAYDVVTHGRRSVLACESEPGRGSVFTVSIPRADAVQGDASMTLEAPDALDARLAALDGAATCRSSGRSRSRRQQRLDRSGW